MNDQIILASGPRPKRLTIERIGLYCFIFMCGIFFLMPLYVMIVTSLKDMDEIRSGNLLYIPKTLSFYSWPKAWSEACTGFVCEGLKPLVNQYLEGQKQRNLRKSKVWRSKSNETLEKQKNKKKTKKNKKKQKKH